MALSSHFISRPAVFGFGFDLRLLRFDVFQFVICLPSSSSSSEEEEDVP